MTLVTKSRDPPSKGLLEGLRFRALGDLGVMAVNSSQVILGFRGSVL